MAINIQMRNGSTRRIDEDGAKLQVDKTTAMVTVTAGTQRWTVNPRAWLVVHEDDVSATKDRF